MTIRTGAFRAALLTGAVCALVLAQPALAQQQRPGGVAPPDVNSTEGSLWAAAETAERRARLSPQVNTDPALNAYVNQVACGIAPEYCGDLRIYVMDRPAFNASMAPNGYMEVWSGLLLRAETEAELAFVLAHEISHFSASHSLAQWNNIKGGLALALVVGAVAGGVSTYSGGGYSSDVSFLGDLAYLGAIAATFNYSRTQEVEADRMGFDRMVAAGYEPGAAVALWRARQDETRASTFPSVRRADAAGSIFRTHPITAERVAALQAMAEAHDAGGRSERERYRAAVRPHLAAWLADDLRRRDFDGALVLTARLERDGQDLGVLSFHRGQIYRTRREDGDLELARDAYLTASNYEDAPVAVWRELGDLQRRLGDVGGARLAYQTYLERATTAQDRWIVEDSLAGLGVM